MFIVIIFDFWFYYILLKEEKLAYNSKILINIVVNYGFLVFKEKYYLGNARY